MRFRQLVQTLLQFLEGVAEANLCNGPDFPTHAPVNPKCWALLRGQLGRRHFKDFAFHNLQSKMKVISLALASSAFWINT